MEEWILKRAYLDYREILKDFPLDEITAKLISKKKFTNKADNGIPGYVFLKELYPLKFDSFYKNLQKIYLLDVYYF